MADNSILENILYVIKMRGEYKAKTCQIFVNLSGFFYVQNFSCSLCFHKNNARAPPFLSILKNSKSKGESKMAEREKYFIALDGQAFEVSRELYEAYYKGRRKEKYFTHDLKQEHTKVDKETGQITVIPSREDSYERLLAAEKQFAEDAEDIEDAAIRAVMLEKLNKALHTLTDEETAIIHALFYQEVSEVELAKQMGIPRTTLRSRKEIGRASCRERV